MTATATAAAIERRRYTWKQAARLAGCSERQLYHWQTHGTISPDPAGWTADDIFIARLVTQLRKAHLQEPRITRVLELAAQPDAKYLVVTRANCCALTTQEDVIYFAVAFPGPVDAVIDLAECAQGL